MFKQSSKREWWILGAILAVASVLRFWKLWELDVQHDAALNAMRALGWFDFLTGSEQTSPIVWFGHIPWWANLSFHDHPPLVFAFEWLSFRLFGQSSFGVFAPFALAGVTAVGLVYVILRRMKDTTAAVLGALVLAVSSYGIWVARTGYLEGIELLWILASFGAMVWFLQTEKPRWLYAWAFFTALALLSKYTALFILPAVLVFFLWRKRGVFRSPHFWLSLGLIIFCLAPVIFYNVMVFRARGHFDAAFSSMVGLHPQDYESISERGISSDVASNAVGLLQSLITTSAIPTVLFWLMSFAAALWLCLRKRAGDAMALLVLYQVFCLSLLFFLGTGARFSVIFLPLVALQIGLGAGDFISWFQAKKNTSWVWKSLTGLIVGCELLFSINTNLFKLPVGAAPWTYSPARFYANGFRKLDDLLKSNFLDIRGHPNRPPTYERVYEGRNLAGLPLIVMDQRSDWFSRVWYIDRYIHYYDAPIAYFSDFLRTYGESNLSFVDFLKRTYASKFIFVMAEPAARIGEPNEGYETLASQLETALADAKVTPFETIHNAKGEPVFTVYAFSF